VTILPEERKVVKDAMIDVITRSQHNTGSIMIGMRRSNLPDQLRFLPGGGFVFAAMTVKNRFKLRKC